VASRSLQSPSFDLTWEPRSGTFRLETPGRVFEGVPGVEFVVRRRTHTLTAYELTAGRDAEHQLDDVHGRANELQLQYQEAQGLALSLRIRLYQGRPFALLRLCVTNVGTTPMRLQRFFVRTTPGGLVTTEAPEAFYANGWQSGSPTGVRLMDDQALRGTPWHRRPPAPVLWNARTPWAPYPDRFWSETVGAVITSREALIGGVASVANQFGQFGADLRPAHLQVTLQTQLDDVPLAVGESRSSEWFYLEWVPLPNIDLFAQYAHAVARQMEVASLRRAPTGWRSWHIYGEEVGEANVMENLASAALLADAFPLDVIQLDRGYQAAWGDWSLRNERFPHSLQWLAHRIRGSRFDAGLWFAPLLAHRSSRLVRDHPEWMLRGAHGQAVRAGRIADLAVRALDPTHPGVIEHLRELVDTMTHVWGYQHLRLGGLYAAALPGRRHNLQMTRAQALRHALTVIREAAGPQVYLTGCEVPLGPAVGLLDAVRVAPDAAPFWTPRAWGAPILARDNPVAPSLRNNLRGVITRAWMHGRWWVNDPDALILREKGSEFDKDEALSQVTLVGLTGGSMFLSDDLDDLSVERRAMAATLFPPLLDGLDALDLTEAAMPETVVVPVARSWGRWRLVALFNWSETPVERDLPDSVKLAARQAYHVVDFWEQRYLLLDPGALRPVLHVPAHGVVLLGLRPVKPEPHLVATTFHISQGGEVAQWSLGEDELRVNIDIGRVARGAIWIALPSRPERVYLGEVELPEKAVRAVAHGVWSIQCQVSRTETLRILRRADSPSEIAP
jgi:alpha-galactosidase